MPNRKRKVVTDSKINSPAMISMRESAWGWKARSEVRDTLEHADRLRDDAGLLTAAEVKRLRKQAKALKLKGLK